MSKAKKFDVLEEVEKQYEESMNEDCQHCGINDPRQSNRYCEACGRIDPDTGKWYWYETEGSEIDLIQDDPAALAAEMEHQTELHIENLFEERKKVFEELLEIDKILLTDEDYDYDHEVLQLDASDLYFELKLIEQEIMELQEYGYIKSSEYTENNRSIRRSS